MEESINSWTSYATMCRLCLQRDGFMLGIFNHIQGKEKSIHKKILDFTALEISNGDGLPTCICHRCLFKIELCLEFKQQCIISDATLRQANGLITHRSRAHHSKDVCPTKTVPSDEFEQFSTENQELAASQVDSVVMVVDPLTLDYDSEYETENERQSDAESHQDVPDYSELRNVSMCKYCDRAFTNATDCSTHERQAHNNEIPYACVDCEMGFADRANYTAHMKMVHRNDKPFGCPDCTRNFSRRSDLRKHTIVHTGVKPYTCHICFKSFSRNTNLSKHLRIHSGHKPFVCPQCPKTFISKGDLTRHAIIHSGSKPFACNFCDQTFGRRDKLIRHEKCHFVEENHTKTTNDYDYPVVKEERIELEADDEEDMVINVDPFNHEGSFSSMPPDEARELPRIPDHIENAHITAETTTTTTTTLKPSKRIKTMNAVKRYPCLTCHKRFGGADALRIHQTVHSGDRPHTCGVCKKNFMRKRELDRHQATHSGMKPYKCGSCEKRFGRKDKLGRHMKIHDIKREHICVMCGATFNRKDGLAHHMKTHNKADDSVNVFTSLVA